MRGIKRTKETFIEDAIKIHGKKYDYSKVVYVHTDAKVKIICQEHGEFLQTPNEHLKGRGCPKCGKNVKRKTTKQFIQESKLVHGEKYDYSKVNYINNRTKVCIICPEHGEFWQQPKKHLISAQGCPKCHLWKGKKVKDVNNISFSNTINYSENFIKKASIIHKNKYDYTKVDYINSYTKVCIICPKHGEFWQTPHSHLEGKACPLCGRKFVTTETYVDAVKEKYGEKYDYSKINYINRKTPITIICKEHGDFQINPAVFMNNVKSEHCPICQNKKNILETKLFNVLQEQYKNLKIIRKYRNYKILGRKEIDIYFPELKIGIEYQGGQHFMPVEMFGGEKQFYKQLKLDYEKINECNNNNIKLLHFTFDEKIIPNVSYKVYNNINELLKVINTYNKNG